VSGGVYKYYRRLARGWAGGSLPAMAPAEDVVLRAPLGTTTLHSISGRQYTVDDHGCVVVIADDAGPLIANGWQRVERYAIVYSATLTARLGGAAVSRLLACG
jgi:hypothetical protein